MVTTRTQIYLDGAFTPSGIASTYQGVTTGSATVYMEGSSLTINSEDPQRLRQLAAALIEAADELEANRQAVA